MPEVSVIIPNYNHAPYLRQRIDSVLAQSYQDFEVILLDDNSTDNSREILDSYKLQDQRITTVIYNKKNTGSPFIQWKKGIDRAVGKWVWIAESDDYADPSFLQALLSLTKKYENIGIAFCNSNWVDNLSKTGISLSVHKHSFFRQGHQEIKDYLCTQCTIQNASSAIIRRDLAEAAVKGLENYKACGDWIFYTRVLHESNIVYTEEKLNYFRWYHNNTSNMAQNNGYWINEGIDVLDNINLKRINFSMKEFTVIIKFWMSRIFHGKGSNIRAVRKLFNMTGRYLVAKLGNSL